MGYCDNAAHPAYFATRRCLRRPEPVLFEAAFTLDQGAGLHLQGDREGAAECFRAADTPGVRTYIEEMWGKRALWPRQVHFLRHRVVDGLPPRGSGRRSARISTADRRTVVGRDGFRCRYCSLPVVPASIRQMLNRDYPEAVAWGSTNASQHAVFQALWLQFDHVVPLARGGANAPANIVVSCAACNFMKWDYHLSELGIDDPMAHLPVSSCWDGLTRLAGGVGSCPL